MSLLGKLLGTVIDTAKLPISIAKDVIPGAGGYVDGERSETVKNVEQIADDAKEIRKEVDEL